MIEAYVDPRANTHNLDRAVDAERYDMSRRIFTIKAKARPASLFRMKRIITLAAVGVLASVCVAQSDGSRPVVLEKNQGEKRLRRPPESLPIPSAEFILKVTPQNGSKHFVLGTEDIPPGGIIPRHKHLGQDEILLVQSGTAHVTLDDKEYDVHAGGTVFFPAQTWVSLKNIGTDIISLVFIFSAPGFEENMRCGSVPAGQPAQPITTDELRACAHKGHVEYEGLPPSEGNQGGATRSIDPAAPSAVVLRSLGMHPTLLGLGAGCGTSD
jgi:quercetin dioxygenase-like cupin family protein